MGVQESEPPTENADKNGSVVEEKPVEVADFTEKEVDTEVHEALALKKQQTKKDCEDWEAEIKAEQEEELRQEAEDNQEAQKAEEERLQKEEEAQRNAATAPAVETKPLEGDKTEEQSLTTTVKNEVNKEAAEEYLQNVEAKIPEAAPVEDKKEDAPAEEVKAPVEEVKQIEE